MQRHVKNLLCNKDTGRTPTSNISSDHLTEKLQKSAEVILQEWQRWNFY